MRPNAASVVAVSFVVLTAAVASSCVVDHGEYVRLDNRSSATVEVYEQGEFVKELRPGKKASIGVLKTTAVIVYQVRRLDGTVALERRFTWDEIHRAHGFDITITDETLSPGQRGASASLR